MKKLIAALAIPAFLVGCGGTQGEAVMEPGVAKFYSDVEAAGFTIENRIDVLVVGENVCEALQQYTSDAIAYQLIEEAPAVFSSFGDTQLFISAAATNICSAHNKSKETS